MKKDYKNHPFRVGDTVYHYAEGKGKITAIQEKGILVKSENGQIYNLWGCGVAQLSFIPYEIPSSWERPFEPKEGDILHQTYYRANFIYIHDSLRGDGVIKYKACIRDDGHMRGYDKIGIGNWEYFKEKTRFATEEEKRQLFDALEKDGKRWNPDTMQVEDIPEPIKEGDLVIAWDGILSEEGENNPIIGMLDDIFIGGHKPFLVGVYYWENAVKFESMEQYEKIRRGEI